VISGWFLVIGRRECVFPPPWIRRSLDNYELRAEQSETGVANYELRMEEESALERLSTALGRGRLDSAAGACT